MSRTTMLVQWAVAPRVMTVLDATRSDFATFYRERFPRAVRLAALLLAGEGDPESVAQEAFTRLHHRWERVDHPDAYLRRTVANAAKNQVRRFVVERRHRQQPAVLWADLGADELWDAIVCLPSRQRAVIVLRYYEDLTETEIADVLGCRPGTVKSLASRALDELRRVVER